MRAAISTDTPIPKEVDYLLPGNRVCQDGAGGRIFRPWADLPRQGTVLVVPEAGFEPAQSRTPRDFKSLASTNSATPARTKTK